MNAARVAVGQEPEPRLSISSVVTELAGSNRSGKQRLLLAQAETSDSEAADISAGLLPDQAETGGKEAADISADHTASRGLSETITGTQVVAGGGESHPPDRGEVHQSLVNSDNEQTRLEMSDESEMAAAKAAAELAAAQTGGGDNDVVIIDPSPTNFDPNKMPKSIQSNV